MLVSGELGSGVPRGEKASLANEEAVGRQAQGDVVVQAAPGASLEVAEPDLLLEVSIVLLDPPAALGMAHQIGERRALAEAAIELGHEVVVITGPVEIDYPRQATIVSVISTEEMLTAAAMECSRSDAIGSESVQPSRPPPARGHVRCPTGSADAP